MNSYQLQDVGYNLQSTNPNLRFLGWKPEIFTMKKKQEKNFSVKKSVYIDGQKWMSAMQDDSMHVIDPLSCCVAEINECEPPWTVSCGIYIDCQDIEESYCQCIRGHEIDSQEMFTNETNETCDGKNDSCIFHLLICEVGVTCPTFTRRVAVLTTAWCPVPPQSPKLRTPHWVPLLQFWKVPLLPGILFS